MKWFNKWKEEKWFQLTFAACSAVVLLFVLYNFSYIVSFLQGLWKVFSPVFIAAIIAYIIDPVARFFERTIFKKSKHPSLARNVSVTFATVFVLLIFILLLVAAIPPLIDSARAIGNIVTNAWKNMEGRLTEITFMGNKLPMDSVKDFLNTVAGKLTQIETEDMQSIIQTSFGFGNGVVAFVLGFIIAIYFMLDKVRVQGILKAVLNYCLRKRYSSFIDFCVKCDKILLKYLACSLLESLIVGTANAIFMAILGMPYIGLISVIVGISNLAPTFGPIVGALIGSIALLLINPWYVLWFLIFTLIIQSIDGYILKPKFFGDTLGVSSLLILLTIILGGRIFGTIGILLSIPFAAICQCIVKDYILKKPNADEEQKAEENSDIAENK